MVDAYGRRRLPYPYSYVTELVQAVTISSVTPDESIIDPDCNAYTVVLTPTQLRRFTSALQAGLDLIYPDDWQDLFTSWDNARINPNNPFWVPLECLHMDFCALVETCVETNPGVREKIRELIQESGIGGQDGVGVDSLDSNLDCIYGATESSYDLLIDWWLQVKVAVDAATQLTDAISELIPAGSWLAIGLVQGLEALLTAGTSAYEAWINSAAVENAFRCGIFDSICQRGLPYQMTDDDINAGFDAIEGASPPVALVTGVIKSISTYGALKQLWQLRTDDTCSNDWEALCNCPGPVTCVTTDFALTQGDWEVWTSTGIDRAVWTGNSFRAPQLSDPAPATAIDNCIVINSDVAGTYIQDATVTFSVTPNGTAPNIKSYDVAGGVLTQLASGNLTSTTITITVDAVITDSLLLACDSDGTGFQSNVNITSIELCGSL